MKSPDPEKAAKVVFGILVIPVLYFSAYACWLWWDIHRVSSFCSDVHAGMPLASLPPLAARHWVSDFLVHQGVYDDKTGDWVFYVPVEATIGDEGCAIHHDNKSVVSAEFYSH